MDVLSTPADLDDLSAPLDRNLLHVFVAGPGYGEGIAVALPGAGWLLVDGCQVVAGELPLLELFARWQGADDFVACAVLTHPHTDHAFGIRRVIEETKPRFIGITTSPTDPGEIFAILDDPRTTSSAGDRQRASVVLDALRAIQRRHVASPGDLVPLVDGQTLPLAAARVQATVRGPEAALVDTWLAARRLGAAHLGDPNELSAVVELQFGSTRIVLGSDLPTVDRHGRSLTGGWNGVIARHPQLGTHAALKVPHHGSPAAFHPLLMSAGTGRAWCLSPFNQGRRLPPATPGGIPRLVDLNRRVLLTAAPRPRDQQPIHAGPAIMPLAALPSLFTPAAPAASGAVASSPPRLAPLDPLWCIAFDDRDRIAGAWRGRRAFAVVP